MSDAIQNDCFKAFSNTIDALLRVLAIFTTLSRTIRTVLVLVSILNGSCVYERIGMLERLLPVALRAMGLQPTF